MEGISNLDGVSSLCPEPDPKPQQRPPALPSPFRKPHDLQVPGRIVLNVWRLMRKEVSQPGSQNFVVSLIVIPGYLECVQF